MKLKHLAILAGAAVLSLPALAEPLATVNGTAIDKKELDLAVSQLVKESNGQVKDNPALREQLKQNLITRELLSQEAKRRGLNKTEDFKLRLDAVESSMLQDALFADILKQNPVSDAKIKAAYDGIAGQLKGSKELRAQQIVVESEDAAKKIVAELAKGAKFDALAKSRSKDPAAKQTGGDIGGWVNTRELPPPVAQVLSSLSKGGVSQQPIQSSAGWHVFKLVDLRDTQVPPLDKVKPQLAKDLQRQEIGKAIEALRAKAKIQ